MHKWLFVYSVIYLRVSYLHMFKVFHRFLHGITFDEQKRRKCLNYINICKTFQSENSLLKIIRKLKKKTRCQIKKN